MKAAARHAAANEFGNVVRACEQGLAIVDKAGNGQRAVAALDCIAEYSHRIGKGDIALPHYERVFATYDSTVRNSASRFRLRNNYAVTLAKAGRPGDAVRVLAETIDAWDGTPYSVGTPDAFTTRMLLVRNLARAARGDPRGETAEWLATTEAESILASFAATSPNGVHLAMNGADALAAIADLVSARGDPDRAAKLREAAAARRAEEEPLVTEAPAIRRDCMEGGTPTLAFRGCFLKMP